MGKIIARDLRLVARRLHRMAFTRPQVTCRRFRLLISVGGKLANVVSESQTYLCYFSSYSPSIKWGCDHHWQCMEYHLRYYCIHIHV